MNSKDLKLQNKESHDTLSHIETQEKRYSEWKSRPEEIRKELSTQTFLKLMALHEIQ